MRKWFKKISDDQLSAPSRNMAENAKWALEHQDVKGSRVLVWLSLLIIVVLVVWASFAWIDEVVRGEGKVVPSRQVQIIQSLDGGVVEEILVRPGQMVEEGEVMLRIDPTRYSSSLGENQAESLALMAKAARLEAIATGEPLVMPTEVLEKAPNIAETERHVWLSRLGLRFLCH